VKWATADSYRLLKSYLRQCLHLATHPPPPPPRPPLAFYTPISEVCCSWEFFFKKKWEIVYVKGGLLGEPRLSKMFKRHGLPPQTPPPPPLPHPCYFYNSRNCVTLLRRCLILMTSYAKVDILLFLLLAEIKKK